MKKNFAVALLITVLVQQSFAVSAYPDPIDYQLPDGNTLTILLKGDEFVSWATTLDGYTLILNKDGFYEYAILDEYEDMVCSGVRANNINARSSDDLVFLQSIKKNIRFSSEQIAYMRSLRDFQYSFLKNNSTRDVVGEVHAPVILVEFQDIPFTKTKEDFELLMNQPNYTQDGHTGSVYDFFYSNSYGQLEYTVDIFGPYMMSSNISHYDNNYSGGSSQYMATEATTAAYNDGCDFSNYDLDNDGNVDGIHFIFAGYGQEAGGQVGHSIWSHAWSLWSDLYFNGKRINRYSCSPELRGNSGNSMTHIGVIAHELSHVFGLPDFYDTDYEGSGGNAPNTGVWDIMAGGSWNDNGRTPANHNVWSKGKLGWIEIITLSSYAEITLPNPQDEGIGYRINTTSNNEFFLLENRQKIGWDAYIPSSGMLIYHADQDNENGWYDNCINCDPSHSKFYIKQACTNGTPFPSSLNSVFTDNSMPNALSWAGNNTGCPITEITENTEERTISFKVMAENITNNTVSISVFPENAGNPSGAGTYTTGSYISIKATANQDYTFKEWRKDGEVINTSGSMYSFNVTEDAEFTAHFSSSITTLQDIVLSDGTLNPEFDPDVRTYNVYVGYDVTHLSITGIPTHENATVEGNVENAELNVGTTNFLFKVTAENGSNTKKYAVIVTRGQIGVEDFESNKIDIYPNPANDYIVVESETIINEIKIFNNSGKLVNVVNNVNDNKAKIDINNYSTGIYHIKINDNFLKFVKE